MLPNIRYLKGLGFRLDPNICKYSFVDILFCLYKSVHLKGDNVGSKQRFD